MRSLTLSTKVINKTDPIELHQYVPKGGSFDKTYLSEIATFRPQTLRRLNKAVKELKPDQLLRVRYIYKE